MAIMNRVKGTEEKTDFHGELGIKKFVKQFLCMTTTIFKIIINNLSVKLIGIAHLNSGFIDALLKTVGGFTIAGNQSFSKNFYRRRQHTNRESLVAKLLFNIQSAHN